MKQKQYLLDTCICAYLLRDKQNVRERINAVGFDNCYISEMTIAELKYGKAYGQLKGGPKYREQPLKKFFEAIKVLRIAPVFDLYAEEKARLVQCLYAQCKQMMEISDEEIDAYREEREQIDKGMIDDDASGDSLVNRFLQIQETIEEAKAKMKLE